jgi:hypothetical protein
MLQLPINSNRPGAQCPIVSPEKGERRKRYAGEVVAAVRKHRFSNFVIPINKKTACGNNATTVEISKGKNTSSRHSPAQKVS